MTSKITFHDNANLGNSVTVEFTTAKQADSFIQRFEYFGGSLTFTADYIEDTEKKSRYAVKESYSLFFIINAILYNSYNSQYSWVKSIHREGNRFMLSDKAEYPTKQGIFHELSYVPNDRP